MLSSETSLLLKEYDIRLKKHLGQNLLIDHGQLERIAASGKLTGEDTVLEIGTGSGLLTKELARLAGKVISFEIDSRILKAADKYLTGTENIKIINGDFLDADLSDLFKKEKQVKVIANIPYYVTTPIIEKLLENRKYFSMINLLVQSEFAQRMVAHPSTKEYGSFTIFANYYSKPEILFKVPSTAFIPHPEVGSSVISLIPYKDSPYEVTDEEIFFKVVRASFNQRRKTINKALQAKFDKDIIASALKMSGIDPAQRGETLSIEEFAALSNSFVKISRADA